MGHAVAVASPALALASPASGQEARPPSGTAPSQVREIGSLHVGGRVATIEGLPEREVIFRGDRIAPDPFWNRVRQNIGRWQDQIRAAGGQRGNARPPHMMMMDGNSDDVAVRVQRCMEGKGLMRD